MTENEMVGCHHQLNGHESEQALGDGEGQGSLTCCSPWGPKEWDVTKQLNNNNKWTVSRQASAHGSSQARILKWVANSFSRGSSQPRD